MSDHYLRLIPEDPAFVPDGTRVALAVELLRSFTPKADDVAPEESSAIRFIDQGSNFEQVLCPACRADITEAWSEWMDAAAESDFRDRSITTPCCTEPTDLNSLVYKWPAGFARFALCATNPALNGWLPDEDQSRIEQVLGCRVRQVFAHY
jgi:hypothetical protein